MLNKLSNIHCGACGNRLVADQEDEGTFAGPNLGTPPVSDRSPKPPPVTGAKTVMGMPKIVAKDMPQRAPEPVPRGSETVMGMPKIVAKDMPQRAPEPVPRGSKTVMGMPKVTVPKPGRPRGIGKETVEGMPAIRIERDASDGQIDTIQSPPEPDPYDRAQIQSTIESDPDDQAQLGFLSTPEGPVEEKQQRKPSATLFGMRAAEIQLAAAEAQRLSEQGASSEGSSVDLDSESDPLMFVDTADFETSDDPASLTEPDALIFGETAEFKAKPDAPVGTDEYDLTIPDTLQPGEETAIPPRHPDEPVPKVHSVASLKGEGPGFLETAAMPVLKLTDEPDLDLSSSAGDLSGAAGDGFAQATQLGLPSENAGYVEEETAWKPSAEQDAGYEQTQLGTPTTHLTGTDTEESWALASAEEEAFLYSSEAESAEGGFVVFEGTVEATTPPVESAQPAQPPPMGAHPAEWAAAGGPRPSAPLPPAPPPPSSSYTPWVPESFPKAEQAPSEIPRPPKTTPDYATAVIGESDEFDQIKLKPRGWLTVWKFVGLLGLIGMVASTFLPTSNSTWSHLDNLVFWVDIAPLSVAGLMLIASIPKRFPRLLIFSIGVWAGVVGLALFAVMGTEPFLVGGQESLDFGLVLASCGLILLAGMIGVGGTNDGHMA